MTFNPDSKKQAQEVTFSCKMKKISHPPPSLYLGVYLDSKLNFRENLQNMFKNVNKTISFLRKLGKPLERAQLLAIYNFLLR